jgi:integrase
MRELTLTPDNFHYRAPTKAADDPAIAINCTASAAVSDLVTRAINCTDGGAVRELIEHSVSDSTRTAYASDLKHFREWGGELSATPEMVAAYIAAYAGKLSVATITRRVATLSKAHQAMAGNNPCQSALVKATLQGLRRKHGTAQKQAKALTREDLFALLNAMGDNVREVRDRALLLLGFAGGFRRSELVGLNVGDIEHVRQGIIITLRHSKTDQEGAGRKIGIPHGRTRHCPVVAVMDWLTRSGITEGAIFRPINRHGQTQPERLSGDAVSEVIRERLTAIGVDPEGYSGHSLRAGFATSAAQAGASTLKIRAQTGHASDAMLSRYIRAGELFVGNAAGVVL